MPGERREGLRVQEAEDVVKAFKKYEVTLRRDVQQKLGVFVDAPSPKDAIDSAEAAATAVDDEDWKVEEFISTHRPKAELAPKAGRE